MTTRISEHRWKTEEIVQGLAHTIARPEAKRPPAWQMRLVQSRMAHCCQ
jgi:hypothetical protein